MLKNFCIFIVMILPIFSIAQIEGTPEEIETKTTFHEIGINTTSVLNQIFNFSDETIPQSPYFLTYKLGINKNVARVGLGFDFNSNERFIDGTSDKVTSINSSLNIRLGYEYREYFGKRWIGTFGVDGIFRTTLDELVSDTSFDRVTIREKGIGRGGGLVIGLQFLLNKRLMLGTEGAFYFLSMETTQEEIFETSTQFNTDPEIETDRMTENILPATIYLIFRF